MVWWKLVKLRELGCWFGASFLFADEVTISVFISGPLFLIENFLALLTTRASASGKTNSDTFSCWIVRNALLPRSGSGCNLPAVFRSFTVRSPPLSPLNNGGCGLLNLECAKTFYLGLGAIDTLGVSWLGDEIVLKKGDWRTCCAKGLPFALTESLCLFIGIATASGDSCSTPVYLYVIDYSYDVIYYAPCPSFPGVSNWWFAVPTRLKAWIPNLGRFLLFWLSIWIFRNLFIFV